MLELKNLEDFELNHSCTDAGPGFHGDLRFIELMDSLLKESDAFIETGTNMGNTLYFVSRNYNIPCYSCEIVSDRTPTHVLENHNITWKNTSSPSFLHDIVKEESDIVDKKCVFYLDAHFGYQIDVLFSELEFIIDNFSDYYIVIDDCDINNKLFLHNGYSLDEIIEKASIKDRVLVPNYTEQTSDFHDLTGWTLITNDTKMEFVNAKLY